MFDHRTPMAQMGSTKNRLLTEETDVCLESYTFETEQITVLNRSYNLLTRYL